MSPSEKIPPPLPEKDGNRIAALPRIIAACEESGGPLSQHVGHADLLARNVAEEINHLLGARRYREYADARGSDVVLAPGLIAALLRAARGEKVKIGRLIFNAQGINVVAAIASVRAIEGGR